MIGGVSQILKAETAFLGVSKLSPFAMGKHVRLDSFFHLEEESQMAMGVSWSVWAH